jgi:hypothetical protein
MSKVLSECQKSVLIYVLRPSVLFLNLLELYGTFVKYEAESSYMGNMECALNR